MNPSLLVIDNYDSFTYNLVQMFRHYPLDISVFRADKITVEEVERRSPDYIVVSPGPKDPSAAGVSIALILHFYKKVPIFGVCLGMQCINEAFGGRTVRAPFPMHGKTSLVEHTGKSVFRSVNQPTTVARYHSLAVEQIHTDLEITAKTSDGVVMGLSHKMHPLHAVQFHPESFLTEEGFTMLENFLSLGPLQEQLS